MEKIIVSSAKAIDLEMGETIKVRHRFNNYYYIKIVDNRTKVYDENMNDITGTITTNCQTILDVEEEMKNK